MIEQLLMPNTYVKHVAQEFADHATLTKGTGIAPEDLLQYRTPVTVAQHLQIIRNAVELAERPEWYMQWGQRMAEHFHGPITMAWLSAPTLGAGLDAFLKYIPGRVPYHRWRGYAEGDGFVSQVEELIGLGTARITLVEIPLLVMHEYVRTLRPGPLTGARIELCYAAPSHAAAYAESFLCPVAFGQQRNAFVIPSSWRAVPNMGYDEATWQTSLRHCEALCVTSADRDTLADVRRLLFERFTRGTFDRAIPNLDTIANSLHMSPRTLIRRLRALDTTYQAVTDEVQKHRARELLANPSLRIHAIAEQLGYRDATSFVRTFKRWYSTTPGAYRAAGLPASVT